MDKRISNKIYMYSFFMALIIVMYHFDINYTFYMRVSYINKLDWAISAIWDNVLDGLAGMSVGYFFLSSAFLLYCNLTEENIVAKLKKRFVNLIVPYLIWNVISMVIQWVALEVPIGYQGVMMLFTKWVIDPYDGPLWFMIVLLIYMVAAPILLRLRKYRKLLIGSVVCLYVLAFVYCACGLYQYCPLWTGWVERFVRYLPIYFTGAVAGLLKPELVFGEDADKRANVAKGIWVAAMLVIALDINFYLTWILVAMLPVVGWYALERTYFEKEVKERYKVSFLIYAVHMNVLFIIAGICKRTSWAEQVFVSGMVNLALYAVVTILVLAVVWLLQKLLKKVPRINALLTGNR